MTHGIKCWFFDLTATQCERLATIFILYDDNDTYLHPCCELCETNRHYLVVRVPISKESIDEYLIQNLHDS